MGDLTKRRLLIGAFVAGFLAVVVFVSFVYLGGSPTNEKGTEDAVLQSSVAGTTAVETAIDNDADTSDAKQLWLVVAMSIACLTALIAVVVAFYLYRWRRILIAGQSNALVPEAWGAEIKNNSKATQDLISAYKQNIQSLSEFLGQHSDAVREMTKTFMEFKKSLDEKDAEIERLRQGYDSHVYRKFLNRFIRVHRNLLENAADGGVSATDLKTLTLLLEDALEESGVAPFEPNVGDDIRKLGDRIADNPKVMGTTDAEAHLTIAEVNVPGYEIVSGEQPNVLIPAQVTVYRSSNTAEEV